MAAKLFSKMGDASRKKLEIAVAIVVIAIAVLALLPGLDMGLGEKEQEQQGSGAYFDAKAERLALQQTLSAIKGAGKVEVMVTYQGTPEIVPALETNSQRQSTEENNQNGGRRSILNQTDSNTIASEQDKTVIVSEKRPEVLGVVVVAEGADDISVKVALTGAVKTALGVSPDRVNVYEMTK